MVRKVDVKSRTGSVLPGTTHKGISGVRCPVPVHLPSTQDGVRKDRRVCPVRVMTERST